MALVICPECGQQISDKATYCIRCGCPIQKPQSHQQHQFHQQQCQSGEWQQKTATFQQSPQEIFQPPQKAKWQFSAIALLVAVCLIWKFFFKPEKSADNDTTKTAQTQGKDGESTITPEVQESNPEKESTQSNDGEVAEKPLTERYGLEITASFHELLDRFITGYEISFAPQKWTLADFDEKGAVIGMADLGWKSGGDKEKVVIVITPIIENSEMTGSKPHYISIGGRVYGDDGYCDEVFNKINRISEQGSPDFQAGKEAAPN